MLTLRKTSLFEEHKKAGAKLVDFAGFSMPLQYQGIIFEHNSVRKSAGIFDVSHMGEFLVSGSDALNYLNYLVPNEMKKIEKPGNAIYTQLCSEKGGTIDDLIIYHIDDGFLVVVNASNIEKDWLWFNKHKSSFNNIKLVTISDSISLIALQGPKSEEIINRTLNINVRAYHGTPLPEKYFSIKKYQDIWISRTGYTGEDGFEIFIDNEINAVKIWGELIKAGAIPCGLGSRDTLRLEACYPLYGHELDENTSPLEAGLSWSVKLNKKDNFIGKEALLKQKSEGLKKKLVCLKINDKLIARQGHKVYNKNKNEIGIICSGSQGITVGYPIATAYVLPEYSTTGSEAFINIRDRLVSATIVQKPFYRKVSDPFPNN